MTEQRKSTVMVTIITAFIASGLFLPGLVGAGDLEPAGAPGSTMYTLEDIYNALANGFEGLAPVEKTGQTTCYDSSGDVIECGDTGQDGESQIGVAWPTPRFTDNGDGTVTDNLTGLIWLKNANRFGARYWEDALGDCNLLEDDGTNLTDGSSAGDWRLPNVKELLSLIDFGRYAPAFPSGHPFSNVQSSYYWSSTTGADSTNRAWGVGIDYGGVRYYDKPTVNYYVWPVRGGN
jgi:hypothetical protein